MTTLEKGKLIGEVISQLRFEAELLKKQFSEGDVFFSLAFASDDELLRIARLAGIA